jgi:hypothetical protein
MRSINTSAQQSLWRVSQSICIWYAIEREAASFNHGHQWNSWVKTHHNNIAFLQA